MQTFYSDDHRLHHAKAELNEGLVGGWAKKNIYGHKRGDVALNIRPSRSAS